MVKIFKGDVLKHGDPTIMGGYYLEMPDTVSLQDYLALQAALREVLDEWEGWLDDATGTTDPRISELRKLIDDK